jgi:hypothetical protein
LGFDFPSTILVAGVGVVDFWAGGGWAWAQVVAVRMTVVRWRRKVRVFRARNEDVSMEGSPELKE